MFQNFSRGVRIATTSTTAAKAVTWAPVKPPLTRFMKLPPRRVAPPRFGPALLPPRMRMVYAASAAPDKADDIDLWQLFEAAEQLDAARADATSPTAASKGAHADGKSAKGESRVPLSIAQIVQPPTLGRLHPEQWAVLRQWGRAQQAWRDAADPQASQAVVGSTRWLLTALKQDPIPDPAYGTADAALKQMLLRLARYDAPRSKALGEFRSALASCRGPAQTAMLARQYFGPNPAGRLSFVPARGLATTADGKDEEARRAALEARWEVLLAPLRRQRLQEARAKFQRAKNYTAFLEASALAPAVFDEIAFALLTRGAIFAAVFDSPRDEAWGIDFFTNIGKALANCKAPGEFACVVLYFTNGFTGKKTQPALLGIAPDGRVSFLLNEVIVGARFQIDPMGAECAWGIAWDGFDTEALLREFPSAIEPRRGATAPQTYATQGLPPAAFGKGRDFKAFTEHCHEAAAVTRNTLEIEFDRVAPGQALARLTEEAKQQKFSLDLPTYERLKNDQLFNLAPMRVHSYAEPRDAARMVDTGSIRALMEALEKGRCVELEDEAASLLAVFPTDAAVVLSDRGLMPPAVRRDYLGDRTTTYRIETLVGARSAGNLSAEAAKEAARLQLFIRRVTEADKEAMRALLASLGSDDFRTRFSHGVTVDDALQAHLQEKLKYRSFAFGVFDRSGKQLIGLGIFGIDRFPTPASCLSLAIVVDPKHRGQGVAGEAIRWSLALAYELGVRRWNEMYVEGNQAARKALERMVTQGFATPKGEPVRNEDWNEPAGQQKFWIEQSFKLNPSAASLPLIEAHGALYGQAQGGQH